MLELTDPVYDKLCTHVYSICGVTLSPQKKYFVEGRLRPVMESEKLSSYQTLIERSVNDRSGRFRNLIVDAITINETSFFRDRHPFTLLEHKLIPDALDRLELSSNRLRRPAKIWSAACATGQEPYSTAMTCYQMLGDEAHSKVQIYATDVSEAATIYASAGIYSDLELSRGLPSSNKTCYFQRVPEGWRMRDEVRSLIQFGQYNLVKSQRIIASYDIIFCRYVAIYFTPQDRVAVFQRLVDALAPGGSLIIGAAEILPREVKHVTKYVHHGSTHYLKEIP